MVCKAFYLLCKEERSSQVPIYKYSKENRVWLHEFLELMKTNMDPKHLMFVDKKHLNGADV